jgi:hypothetical protein
MRDNELKAGAGGQRLVVSLATRLIMVAVFLSASGAALNLRAQDAAPSPSASPTPTPTAEEQRLIDENTLLTLQKTNAELRKGIRDAQVKPTATPLGGTATVDTSIEVEMMSYDALSGVAKKVGDEILDKAPDAKVIAVYSAADIKDWRFYKSTSPAFAGRMETLKSQYQSSVNPPGAGLAPLVGAFEAGTTALSSFVDLLAFFRSDVEIKGKDVTIARRPLVNEVLRALRNSDDELVLLNPAEFPPQLIDPTTHLPFESPTLVKLGELYILKAKADKLISNLKELAIKEAKVKEMGETSAKNTATIAANLEAIKPIDKSLAVMKAKLNKLKPNSAKAKALQARIAEATEARKKLTDENAKLTQKNVDIAADVATLTARIAILKGLTNGITATVEDLMALNEQFLAFVADFVKVDASTGTNPLTVFVKAENLDKAMEDPESYWVEINVDKAGGNNRVRKNLIRFLTGPKVDHSGGIVIDYTLYDKTGTVIYSDKLSLYRGYLEPKKIQTKKKTFGDAVSP